MLYSYYASFAALDCEIRTWARLWTLDGCHMGGL